MPSTFPPPSVERHHSRRRSGRYDDPEAQTGNYSSRPSSGHYNEGVAQPNPPHQPRSSYENPNPANYQDPYHQATSSAGTYQTLDPRNPQQGYNANPHPPQSQHNNHNDGSYPTSTYQPPTGSNNNRHHSPSQTPHSPRHPPRSNNHGSTQKRSLLPFFSRNRNSRNRRAAAPGPGHTLQHQPSPLDYKSKGGRWEDIRAHLVATSGELVGTILFLWFALSAAQVSAMTNPEPDGAQTPQTILFISLAFGFSLASSAWAFYRISGGLFNPAVVLGLCLSGALPWMRGAFLVPAEIVGAMIAAALVQAMFPGDVGATLTLLGPDVSITRGLFIEMFLTSLLIFTILMLAAEKHQATFIAPVGIGLSLFVAELTGVYFTGGSLNPARSFGPSVAVGTFPGYHWIYWLGPAMGAVLAAAYYRLVKYLNYEEANPGQDAKHE